MNLQRNLLIEAGAGTGKTYNLVQAILRALIQKRLPLSSIVALTFTKKAAGEMKERVAAELTRLQNADRIPEPYQDWGLGLDDLKSLAGKALDEIDRAMISTIHSFAFTLLQRFPLAAGINPGATVDEKGLRYDTIFDEEWKRWLARELGENAPHEDEWIGLLSAMKLEAIEALARRLCDFDVPLDSLPIRDDDLAPRLKEIWEAIRPLTQTKGKKPVKNNEIAAACEEIVGIASHGDFKKLETVSPEIRALLRQKATKTSGWTDEDVARLKQAQGIAINLLLRGDALLSALTARLKPFIMRFRMQVLAQGELSHNALLALACRLVKTRHDIRLELKRDFRMIFIDEFQDTDPLQGELLLFLAEKPEGRANDWSSVQLEAGKLFVVGDPKQSIYRFRGADISAYRQISDLILAQGGQAIPLQKSWRSHQQIIEAVNGAFSTIIQEKGTISPPYIPLLPQRPKEAALPLQEVELRLVDATDDMKASESREIEAVGIASWIQASAGTLKLPSGEPLKHKDIALIFRSSSAMRPFVEALRTFDIPYVVEGERYFYSTPEVTDLINLLRVIEIPGDRLALVGFLRSPLGGFTDPELVDLQIAGCLDASKPLPPGAPIHHQKTWALLKHLHERVQREPLKDVLRHVFEETYLMELAARSYHRDQTLANVLKLKRLLEEFAEEGDVPLSVLLKRVRLFMDEDQAEGESPLADDSFDAVRLMTIHKSKGLEFPVVILPNLQAPRQHRPDTQDASVVYDWSTQRLGLRVAGLANLTRFQLDAETEAREEEEEKRVLYVALTRAKERLILTGSTEVSSNSYLQWLLNAWQIDLTQPPAHPQVSRDVIFTPAAVAPTAPSAPNAPTIDARTFADIWKKRTEVEQKVLAVKTVSTATSLVGSPAPQHPTSPSSDPRRLGTLLHLFLEHWDFTCKKCDMPARLRSLAVGYFAREGLPVSEGVINEAQKILAGFIGSEDFQEIAQSEILGREVPFFYKTSNEFPAMSHESLANSALVAHCSLLPLMRGTMDVLYRKRDGTLVIGDYKSGTPRAESESTDDAQSRVYREAVRLSTGEEAVFKRIPLRIRG